MNETPDHADNLPHRLQQPEGADWSTSLIAALLILLPRLRLLIAVPLLMGAATLGLSYLIPPVFTASTRLLPPQQQTSAASALLGSLGGVAGALSGNLGGLKNPTEQWIGLLKSRVIADAIVNRFTLQSVYDNDYRFQARNQLAANTAITTGKDGLIEIKVDDHKPERAVAIAAAYVEELRQLSSTLAVTEAAQRRLFFEKQLAEAKQGLIKAEAALKDGGIDRDVVKTNPTAAVAAMARAQAAVAAQEVRISVMRGSMTESNPELEQAQLQLSSLREQLRRFEEAVPAQGDGQSIRYVARYRDFKYYEALYEMFARQYEAAKTDEARDGALIQVVDPPVLPEHKSKPKRAFIALFGYAFALVVVIIWIFAANRFRRFRQDPAGAEQLDALRRAVRPHR